MLLTYKASITDGIGRDEGGRSYYPEIDGLRAAAVALVVLYHLDLQIVSRGFLGVDMFFVISGYVITRLLWLQVARDGVLELTRFWERRIRRLIPALATVVITVLAAGAFIYSPIGGEQQMLAKSAIAAVAMVSNLFFLSTVGGYFEPVASQQPLLHTWSLSLEEQFYLFWPLAIALVARNPGSTVAGRERRLLAFLALVGTISFAAWLIASQLFPKHAFYLMPLRVWEFAIGGLAWILHSAPIGWRAGLTGAAGMIAVAVGVLGDSVLPSWLNTCVVCSGSFMMLWVMKSGAKTFYSSVLSFGPMVRVGRWSYSIYLWHWPVLVLLDAYYFGELGPVGRAAAGFVSVVAGAGTYHFIENPIRSKSWALMSTSKRTYAAGAAIVLVCVIASGCLAVWAKWIWPSIPGNLMLANAVSATKGPDWLCVNGKKLDRSGQDERHCVYGAPARHQIVFWGDSHAGHLEPVASRLSKLTNGEVRVSFRGGCPPVVGVASVGVGVNDAAACDEFLSYMLAELRAKGSKEIRAVVLAARWDYYLSSDEDAIALLGSLREIVQALKKLEIRVFIVEKGVDLRYPGAECLRRRSAADCSVSRKDAEAQRLRSHRVIASIQGEFPEVQIIDPLNDLCGEATCEIRKGEGLLYIDRTHLSSTGSLLMLGQFRKSFDLGQ